MSNSLWTQSIAAFFWGLFLSISFMLNLNKILPLQTDTQLFVGLLIGFISWAGVISYCLSHDNAWQAAKRCGLWLLVSASLNVVLYWALEQL